MQVVYRRVPVVKEYIVEKPRIVKVDKFVDVRVPVETVKYAEEKCIKDRELVSPSPLPRFDFNALLFFTRTPAQCNPCLARCINAEGNASVLAHANRPSCSRLSTQIVEEPVEVPSAAASINAYPAGSQTITVAGDANRVTEVRDKL